MDVDDILAQAASCQPIQKLERGPHHALRGTLHGRENRGETIARHNLLRHDGVARLHGASARERRHDASTSRHGMKRLISSRRSDQTHGDRDLHQNLELAAFCPR